MEKKHIKKEGSLAKFENENNQYGFEMTKSMQTDCIKEHLLPSWKKFNLLFSFVSVDDKIGHLFVVDIEFDFKKCNSKRVFIK